MHLLYCGLEFDKPGRRQVELACLTSWCNGEELGRWDCGRSSSLDTIRVEGDEKNQLDYVIKFKSFFESHGAASHVTLAQVSRFPVSRFPEM